MIVKVLTEHHLEYLSLKGGCRGSSESALVKMSNCWKSHAAAHYYCFHGERRDIWSAVAHSVGRVLDWGLKGCWFELHHRWSHCVVSLSSGRPIP